MKAYFFLLLCCVLQVSAENITQLTDDEYQQLRSDILSNYSDEPIQAAQKADEFLLRYKQRFSLSQNLKMHYTKVYFLVKSEQFEAAYSALSSCKILADQLNDPGLTYYYYSYLGGMLDTLESYQLSLKAYLTAVEYAQRAKDDGLQAQVYNNVGHVLTKLQQFEQAQFYIDKFYQYGLTSNNQSYISTALNNFGEISLAQRNFAQAKKYLLDSLSIRQQNNFQIASSWSHYNLGKVYLAEKQYDQALDHLKSAIDIRLSYDMELEAIKPQVVLASIYLQQQKYSTVLPIIMNIIDVANSHQHKQLASDGYKLLRNYYNIQNEYQLAMQASDNYLMNELAIHERKASVALMHYVALADLTSKEVDNIALRKENELISHQAQAKQTQLITILGLSAIIIAITLIFLTKLANKNHKLNTALEELKKTQQDLLEADKMSAMTTLVSGIAHQLNTPLSVVITANSVMRDRLMVIEQKLKEKTLNLQAFQEYIEEAKSVLALSEKNSEKTVDLVQRFKLISAELEGSQISSFELKLFILEKLRLIASQYQQFLSIEVVGEEVQVLNYPDVLLTVLEQLVKNTAEHKPENLTTVQAEIAISVENEWVNIVYTDNGMGISEQIRERIFDPFFTTKGMQKSLGLGLNIAYNSVIHLMQGKLSCQASSSGARFVIEMPIVLNKLPDSANIS